MRACAYVRASVQCACGWVRVWVRVRVCVPVIGGWESQLKPRGKQTLSSCKSYEVMRTDAKLNLMPKFTQALRVAAPGFDVAGH